MGSIMALASFLPNERCINYIIPTEDGALVVPHFIQCQGGGEVKMVAGRECREPVYVSKIFLAPDYSCIPTNPMGPWFLQLLIGAAAGFNTLAKATHELPDWEPYAEIVRYRKWEQEHRQIEAEVSELTGHCAVLQEAINNCRGQLEATGVPLLLHNLEGHAGLPHSQGYLHQGRCTCFNIIGAPL